ncbi:hypothetical protein K2173_007671 [Erythroxylum novogranatense]|uniref:DUF4283 domain-containing protein n=1 Tax=Erythroxylum novogranatense TaxID=1862640 RepID=A0AAV8TS65_9ROSI|nr:hypothetical protein K2173_007671 [Erythroxylum novogranatense]
MVLVDDDIIQEVGGKWNYALIVKVYERSVNFMYLENRLNLLWKPSAGLDLIDLEFDFYLAKFEGKEDMLRIVSDGPYIIRGQPLYIQKWKPGFQPSTTNISSRVEDRVVIKVDKGLVGPSNTISSVNKPVGPRGKGKKLVMVKGVGRSGSEKGQFQSRPIISRPISKGPMVVTRRKKALEVGKVLGQM